LTYKTCRFNDIIYHSRIRCFRLALFPTRIYNAVNNIMVCSLTMYITGICFWNIEIDFFVYIHYGPWISTRKQVYRFIDSLWLERDNDDNKSSRPVNNNNPSPALRTGQTFCDRLDKQTSVVSCTSIADQMLLIISDKKFFFKKTLHAYGRMFLFRFVSRTTRIHK